MRIFITASAVLALSLTCFAYQEHHHAPTEQEIGSVQFATSCTPAGDFNRAVALLHSFQYENARAAFAKVSAEDPTCAMAYWGVAMSHYHGLWKSGDAIAGRQALVKAKQTSLVSARTTKREVAYIDALAEIYREDGKGTAAHAQAFRDKMKQLHQDFPGDTEAAIFYALALDITAPKTDKTFANQKQCGEILEPIFAQQPHHPGVAHYIIHCYDNPVLASRGLNAARVYASVAPASAHANHMPSHIFTRLGLWDESIASNRRSASLAAADEAGSTNGEARDQRLHAMDYLEYGYLQSGRVAQAQSILAEMKGLVPRSGLTLTGDYALAAVPARFTLELGKWEDASALEVREEGVPWARAISWMAIGIGSARAGRDARAAQAERELASLRDAASKLDPYWSNQIEVQRREVQALIADHAGNKEDALAAIRSAVELEESMDKDPVTPGPVIPARELLAHMLQRYDRPAEAQREYESVLKVAPNRFAALYGAAVTADQAGDKAAAARYYLSLTAIAVGNERPELEKARDRVAGKNGGEGGI